MDKKYLLMFLAFLLFIIIIIFFMFKMYQYNVSESIGLTVYACHDGCSIATKDSNGYLNNNTWDCWDKCESYIKEIRESSESS